MSPPPPPRGPRALTHQTAEVRPLEPGGGETQGHVRGAFHHLSLGVVGVGGGEVAAAVTAAAPGSCVRPAPPLTPTTPPGQEVGGGSQANVPLPLGFA